MPQLSRPTFHWRLLHQQLWFRPAVWSGIAVLVMALSYSADGWLPVRWVPKLRPDVVVDLLRVLASSMLAVSTFALSMLVAAFASAATAGTPRATKLVVADPRAQNCIAVFLASFIFSIVGVIALGIGDWGSSARFVLFAFSLGMLCWVIYAFMQYMQVLSRIGRVGHTIETIERAVGEALQNHVRAPLGGGRAAEAPPVGSTAVLAARVGFVQLVDMDELQRACEAHGLTLHVAVRTGDLVHPIAPLVYVHPGVEPDSEARRALRKAFVVGNVRTFDQDARYGLIVLAEIAQRALSPAVNDPGTAGAVIACMTRLLVRPMQRSPRRKRRSTQTSSRAHLTQGHSSALHTTRSLATARAGSPCKSSCWATSPRSPRARGGQTRAVPLNKRRAAWNARASEMAPQDLASLERDWRAAFRA